MRGFLGGLVGGAALVVAALVAWVFVAALMSPPRGGPGDPAAGTAETGTAGTETGEEVAPVAAEADPVEAGPAAAEPDAAAAEPEAGSIAPDSGPDAGAGAAGDRPRLPTISPDAPAAPQPQPDALTDLEALSGEGGPLRFSGGKMPGQAPGPDASRPALAALPRLDGDRASVPTTPGTPARRLTEEPGTPTQRGALDEFAAPFEGDRDLPLMALVLIDTGNEGLAALEGFAHPVTIAIDPSAPDAGERMAHHRAAGREVLALLDLPGAAKASDAEVALEAGFNRLSQAIGVLEGEGGFSGERALVEQVAAHLAESGRGLILRHGGPAGTPAPVRRAGVPAAGLFRDLDGAGQGPGAMRRFLDQAALRAGQDGPVILLGRLRPETLAALDGWFAQQRSARVAAAPVSAVLRQAGAGEPMTGR
ncbi:divergent polysaccharide deacetylase family protein [Pontibaca methylaminivorans]|uniref:divergent polysaccharide deacetylase family protein n=1 Tax=Pontibaca methylaminivorans TaxID=515897 RepID=UPI002FDADE0E